MKPTEHPRYRRQLELIQQAWLLMDSVHSTCTSNQFERGLNKRPFRSLTLRRKTRARYQRRADALDKIYEEVERELTQAAERELAASEPSIPGYTVEFLELSLTQFVKLFGFNHGICECHACRITYQPGDSGRLPAGAPGFHRQVSLTA